MHDSIDEMPDREQLERINAVWAAFHHAGTGYY